MEFDVTCGLFHIGSNIFHPLGPGQTIIIGRADDVDLKVDDKRCSRIHAEITHILSKSDHTSTLVIVSVNDRYTFRLIGQKGKSPLVVYPKPKKNPQLKINGKQIHDENDDSVVLQQGQSHVLQEGDEFSLLVDPNANLKYRFQILKTAKQPQNQPDVLHIANNNNKSAPPSPRKMDVDSPNNKRKNAEEYDEMNESPTKQTKNYHHQNNHNNNNHHAHAHNNNNQHHGHQKPDVYYNSEEEEDANYKSQNNNMDDGENDNKVLRIIAS